MAFKQMKFWGREQDPVHIGAEEVLAKDKDAFVEKRFGVLEV